MNELQNEFTRQSAADLNRISAQIKENQNANLTENFLREIFRALHTIKGTAQTFGFPVSANLAHTLENLLSAAKNESVSAADFHNLLPEGLTILAQSLGEKNFSIPTAFAGKIQGFYTEPAASAHREDYLSEIPEEFSAPLSAREKSLLNEALNNGSNLYALGIVFEAANFAAGFKDFRNCLGENGEIIAALAGAESAAPNEIGFRIVYATRENVGDIIENSAAKIVFENSRSFAGDLSAIVAQVAEHGKTLARSLGKNVDFSVSVETENVASGVLKIVFDALLHLVRNAVSHAIDEKGTVSIAVKMLGNNLILTISDDGKGLDAEKIRRRAVEKKLVAANEVLSERELADLIFAPDFSTAEIVTELSGRGVGLDAVKNSIENANGQISVKSEAGKGTSFEIRLPQN